MATSTRTSSSSADLSVSGPAKLEEVTRLLDTLTADLETISLLPRQRDAHLEALKVFGRDPAYAEPIFTKRGIETLARHAFNSPSNTTSRNALRVLANTMLLRPNTQQMFVDLGYEGKACNKLRNDNRDDEFLVSRIIFLTTYDSNVDIVKLIDQYHLAEITCANVGRHSKQYVTKTKKKDVKEIDPMEDMALIETLKLIFNLTYHCPQRKNSFLPAIPHVLTILLKRPIPTNKPLEPPIATLINSLINLDLEDPHNISMFPKPDRNINIKRLIDILEMAIKAYNSEDLESLTVPLLTLIRKVHQIAPRDVQLYMQRLILPTEEDRKQILGRSDTLSGDILRLSINPSAPKVQELISTLLFELSDSDATKFVQNIGYGYASGFLFANSIPVPVPESATEAWSTTGGDPQPPDSAATGENRKPFNPITGQNLESEAKVDLPEMTEEEKEREAEKLFVLFERLKKTGVMSIKNPVESALQEGRFLELEDDADSE